MAEVEGRIDPALLKRAIEESTGPVMRELTKVAVRVSAEAKRLCPVDTGRLRNSITFGVDADSQGPYAVIGTNVEYAPYVEFGTRYQRAQPFLRPAVSKVLR